MRRTTRSSAGTVVRTTTSDGIGLVGVQLDGPGGTAGQPAFVVCHGMTNATDKPFVRVVLAALAVHAPVIAFDFRGHGRSGGASTVGRDEVRDVDAALRFARAAGHERVAVIGFSMGAAVALRHAGSAGGDPDVQERPDAVVSVSAPARWFLRESRSMLRVQWLLEHPVGPLVAPRLGIRLSTPWRSVPSTPLEEAGRIAPVPLLIVHGTEDHYFGTDQAVALHRAAPHSEMWIVDGMRHAESAISVETLDRIADWVERALPPG